MKLKRPATRQKLKHHDWTDYICSGCGTTLTKQEIEKGSCVVCKEPTR